MPIEVSIWWIATAAFSLPAAAAGVLWGVSTYDKAHIPYGPIVMVVAGLLAGLAVWVVAAGTLLAAVLNGLPPM